MDWIGHHNDIAHWGLDMDHAGPERVEAVGWTRLETDIYNTPVDYEIRCQYPGGIETAIGSKFESGIKWTGESGWVKVSRGDIEASDERWVEGGFNRGPWKAYASNDHARNFLDCVKSRKECIAPERPGIAQSRPAIWATCPTTLAAPSVGTPSGRKSSRTLKLRKSSWPCRIASRGS
jgi:hypothetical protein